MSRVEIRTFEPSDTDAAGRLLAARHAAHRRVEPLLAARFEDPAVASSEVEAAVAAGATGAVAVEDGEVIGYLLGQTKVTANEDGTISVPMLASYSGAPKKWREISPWVWQDTASGDRLAAEVADGHVTRFTAEPIAAIMVFQRSSWWQNPPVFLTLVFGSLTVLLLTVLAWPVSALVRRHYGVRYALAGQDARAHRWIRIASLAVFASVAGMIGMILAMMSDLALMSPGADGMVIAVRILVTILLPIGALIALWNAWLVLRSKRSLWAKLWSVVLAASCLSLLFIGIACHLVGYTANY